MSITAGVDHPVETLAADVIANDLAQTRQVAVGIAKVRTHKRFWVEVLIINHKVVTRGNEPACEIEVRAFTQIVGRGLECEAVQKHLRARLEVLGRQVEQEQLVSLVRTHDRVDDMGLRPDVFGNEIERAYVLRKARTPERAARTQVLR